MQRGALSFSLPNLYIQEWDLRNEQQIAECLRHSDTVYNLVGRNYETKYVEIYQFHQVPNFLPFSPQEL